MDYDALITILVFWGIAGVMTLDQWPKPQHAAAAWQQVFLGGPVCWMVFAIVLTDRLLKLRRQRKGKP